MKVLQRLLLAYPSRQVNIFKDLLWFSYCTRVDVEDVITYLHQQTHSHLDKAGSMVRMMIFDFSSVSSTIQPAFSLLCKKLQKIQMDASTTSWIIDYYTNRPQFAVCWTECVWEGGQQHRSTTGGVALTVFLHSLHIRLPVQLRVLLSPEIVWWPCSCWVYQWWEKGWV